MYRVCRLDPGLEDSLLKSLFELMAPVFSFIMREILLVAVASRAIGKIAVYAGHPQTVGGEK